MSDTKVYSLPNATERKLWAVRNYIPATSSYRQRNGWMSLSDVKFIFESTMKEALAYSVSEAKYLSDADDKLLKLMAINFFKAPPAGWWEDGYANTPRTSYLMPTNTFLIGSRLPTK